MGLKQILPLSLGQSDPGEIAVKKYSAFPRISVTIRYNLYDTL